MHMEALIEKKQRPKEIVRPGGLYTILTKSNKLQISDKKKETRLGLLLLNCRKGNIWGKLMEDKDYFYKVC